MASPPDLTFELERGEYITAGGAFALVRIAGAWRASHPATVERPRLCAAAGSHTIAVEPLPDPSAPRPTAGPAGEHWHAAFPLPLDLVADEQAAFWLEAEGVRVRIARPLPRGEAVPRHGAAGGRVAPLRRRFSVFGRGPAPEPAGEAEASLAYERQLRQAVERDLRDQLEEKQAMRTHLHRLMAELEREEGELPPLAAPPELRAQLDEGVAALDALEQRVGALRDAAAAHPGDVRRRREVLRRIDSLDALAGRLSALRQELDVGPG